MPSLRRQNRSPYWSIRFRDDTGKCREISTHTRNRQEANTILREFSHSHYHLPRHSSDLDSLFAAHEQHHRAQGHSEGTIERECLVLKSLRAFLRGQMPSDGLIVAYADNRRAQGISMTTIGIELRTIRAVLNYGCKLGLCPKPQIVVPKQKHKLPTFLSAAEVQRFLAVLDDDRLRLIFRLFLFTGGRRTEIASLTRDDINIERRTVRFRRTKSGAEREIPIEDEYLLAALSRLPEGHIWPYLPPSIYRTYRRYIKKAGITDPLKQKLHCLRHTFASHLAVRGVPLPTISYLLGHRSIQTTMIYVHLLPDHAREEIRKLSYG